MKIQFLSGFIPNLLGNLKMLRNDVHSYKNVKYYGA